MKFSKNLAVRISIWFEMGKNRKKNWHSLTTAADPVLNNFISERVTVILHVLHLAHETDVF